LPIEQLHRIDEPIQLVPLLIEHRRNRARGGPRAQSSALEVDLVPDRALVGSRPALIRPIAYLINNDGRDRLRRPAYPDTPPTYAVVSRPLR